jgi:hypothetical protein
MFRLNKLAIIRPNYKKIVGEICSCILGMRSQPLQDKNTL